MWKKINAYRTFVGKTEGKRPLGDLDIDWRITLKFSLKNRGVWHRVD
jgi:hypothetical protein